MRIDRVDTGKKTASIQMRTTHPVSVFNRLGFSAVEAANRVDRDKGIIYGVSVITEGEAKGHDMQVDAITLQQVMQCAKAFADGLKVKEDHGSGVMATVGVLKNLRVDGKQLRADLTVLPEYEHAQKLYGMAEMMPSTFGLSISFSGVSEFSDGQRFARCQEIYSADLVSEPAANSGGLFSKPKPTTQLSIMEITEIVKAIEEIKSEMSAKFAALEERFTKLETPETPELEDGEKTEEEETEMSALKKQITELSEKISDRASFAKEIAAQFAKVSGSPAPAVSPAVETKADDAEQFAALVGTKMKDLPASRKADAYSLAAKESPKGYQAFQTALKAGRKFTL
jgi:hypothetical protein